jgi:tRNA nucleotidyltransferase (CCA-adding enzyme)
MEIPSPPTLFDRVRSLPAAGPLLARLGDTPGVWLVGGAVRDLLLGGQPSDLDVVVEGDAAALAEQLGGAIRVHDRFGTSTVKLDGFSYDLARARRERYARPGALPDVEPATLAEDLLRRDFTVNATAIALTGRLAGELSAAPLALDDLARRTLRILHDESFIDDPTRLLRLARYWNRLGFEIDPGTFELARVALDGGALRTVSGTRIGAELRILASEPEPLSALVRLHRLGVDRAIDRDFGLSDRHLGDRAIALLPNDGRRDRLALALAARGVPAPELASLLDALAFEADDRDAIIATATRADSVARALAQARTPSGIAAAAAGASPELVALAGALGPEREAREWLTALRQVRLEIDGRDLLAAGVPEGPALGRGLRAALADKLDGRVSGRDAELARALEAARATG